MGVSHLWPGSRLEKLWSIGATRMESCTSTRLPHSVHKKTTRSLNVESSNIEVRHVAHLHSKDDRKIGLPSPQAPWCLWVRRQLDKRFQKHQVTVYAENSGVVASWKLKRIFLGAKANKRLPESHATTSCIQKPSTQRYPKQGPIYRRVSCFWNSCPDAQGPR